MTETQHTKPALVKYRESILSISGPALLEMLRAVMDKHVPFRFTARGFSMWPFIRDGDVITVSPCGFQEIRVGDVIAFVSPRDEHLTVHRVIDRSQDACLIKGDNIPAKDGWIPQARILGRVTRLDRAGKRVWLGFGLERIIIACLSQLGWLTPLLVPVQFILHRFFKRFEA